MPHSRASRTHAVAWSASTCEPCVSQLPYEISLTIRPLRPRCRNSMVLLVRASHAREAGRQLAAHRLGKGHVVRVAVADVARRPDPVEPVRRRERLALVAP